MTPWTETANALGWVRSFALYQDQGQELMGLVVVLTHQQLPVVCARSPYSRKKNHVLKKMLMRATTMFWAPLQPLHTIGQQKIPQMQQRQLPPSVMKQGVKA